MRVKTYLLTLFLFALLVPLAWAALPTSSFMDGSAFYGDDPGYTGHLKGRVDYAVYDTDSLSLADEQDFVDALGLSGQYIYAYQIWNDYPGISEADVGSFEVMREDGSGLAASILNDTGAHDDGEGGIAPDIIESQGLWTWSGAMGFLPAGEHSYFLIFSSNAAPVSGTFEVTGGEQLPVNGDEPNAPEPATVALFGLGSMIVFARRRKAV
jgi:hypothetical protein